MLLVLQSSLQEIPCLRYTMDQNVICWQHRTELRVAPSRTNGRNKSMGAHDRIPSKPTNSRPSGTQHPAKSRRACIRKIFVLARERSGDHHLYLCRSSSPHATHRKPASRRSKPYQRPRGKPSRERRRQCRIDPPSEPAQHAAHIEIEGAAWETSISRSGITTTATRRPSIFFPSMAPPRRDLRLHPNQGRRPGRCTVMT
jgi:hypothetical protein